MVSGIRRKVSVFQVLASIFLGVVLIATLYPFLEVLAVSMSDARLVNAGEVRLVPRGVNFDTYARVISNGAFWVGYRNTIVYTVVGTAIAIVLTTLTAYPLAKHWLPGGGVVLGLFVFTMFFNGGLIPNFLLIRSLGWLNTVWAIVIPLAVNPWNMVIMRTFFRAIPQSLEEAAEIDGLGPWQTLFRVVLPLSKPIMATMGLFYSVWFWNDWFRPFILLTDTSRQPVTLFLRNIVMGAELASLQGVVTDSASQSASVTVKGASIILVVLPILFVYPFVQKYFVKGVLIGSVKG